MNIILSGLNNILNCIFKITGDWGISIILLTILIRILLLPISIKQKKSIAQQQKFSKKIEELKVIYKDNKKKLEEEMQRCYEQSAKSMMGCLVSLLQLPIISSLYILFNKMPVEVGTIIVPWISNIKMSDKYFIIPMIYTLISLSPYLISYIPFLNIVKNAKVEKINIIMTVFFSILITIKTPITVGIYFITTGLFSLFEEILYRLYCKKYLIKSR
ncbi:membrane protein insertase YidC [Clostridium acetireducens DSM 10703]|jgi:YidC/Oxa1 family membrane protein insertase|uniref:Membrane protein insertase YidC n=1 Tax=Clostridium acetireducens DSM 10703 TaxID=1121290 RepID=A0A1E8EVR4_9CLOT|nr:membrane protein insertase YidC [Clostridium acetireducens]OFI01351.1 membrane protein insertase YidC [Clostridium acetireducens DSM 10703]